MEWQDYFRKRTVTDILEPGLNEIGKGMGHYRSDVIGTLEELIGEGKVIRPRFREGDSRVYRAYKCAKLIEDNPDKVFIMPYDAGIYPKMRGGSVLNKFNVVSLGFVASSNDALERRVTPRQLMREAFGKVKPGETNVGYAWRRLDGEYYNVTTLVDCILGKLLADNVKGLVRLYDEYGDPDVDGAKAMATVPSIGKEDEKFYDVVLESIPVVNLGKEGDYSFSQWFDLSSQHMCKRKQWAIATRRFLRVFDGVKYMDIERTAKEFILDFHDIDAFFRIKKYMDERNYNRRILKDRVPFVEVSEETMEYYRSLLNSLDEVKEAGRVRRVPLAKWKQEISLWSYVGYKRLNAFVGLDSDV